MDFPADLPADFPAQAHPHSHGGWPGNELEEVLSASLGVPSAGGRIIEVLGRSFLWVPLPSGGGPNSGPLDLPTMEIEGQGYVPVFSSEEQFRQVVGTHMSFAVAPAVEFARGLPPQVGIMVNPDGVVGIPLPPPAVAELCRVGRTPLDGPASGGRVKLFEPDWKDDPVDFLSAASAEFAETGVVTTARRCLAAVETADPVMFVGVELSHWEGDLRTAPMDALGRALGRVPTKWQVNLILLDMAAQDPVTLWMREHVRPFYTRG
ncbi:MULTISPECIES: enhanced serine sensitivity protein SseB [Streptomyces]|uniref:Enhanced serine sensitivity protein SseB n=1 Tax=Streptomyces fuscus TaxID=3048495 RepID=A0ABT7J9A9_9ACTN|nr:MULTISPECIES: enhanced serine sensitivity protein SseB [Streptomyces]MCM1971674.1 enhanced serine sensitivity protein SseB [Streptomyces sp. G1]MDL2081475.1 enhanced serine sensitivity protein SseB [Streptomyces fuscus]SBT93924.1 SseB protein N-terminal domain-containing protein [Streptomyces sp. DI166]